MANRTNDENLDLFYLNIEQEKILKKIIRIMQN